MANINPTQVSKEKTIASGGIKLSIAQVYAAGSISTVEYPPQGVNDIVAAFACPIVDTATGVPVRYTWPIFSQNKFARDSVRLNFSGSGVRYSVLTLGF